MSNILEEANSLLKKGFSVFPVNISWNEKDKKFDKKPAVPWKEYQERFATDEEVKEWFGKNKHNGLGVATGKLSGVVVVDVETEDLEDIIKEFGLESGLVSNTISGGKHFFYKWPDRKIPNTVRIKDKKVDFRGDGGFVVVPPSGEGKSEYTWDKKGEPSTLPDILEEKEWKEKKEPLKLSEYSGVEKGSRNDSLYRVACSLIYRHGKEEAWQLVNDINRTYSPPLTDHEVRQLFGSASDFQVKEKKEKQENKGEVSLISGSQVWSDISEDKNKKEWIWENYIAKRNITVMSSLWKTGKSTFIRCLLKSLAKEEEFVGQPTTKSKVFVVSEEDTGQWAEHKSGNVEHVIVNSRPSVIGLNFNKWEVLIEDTAKWCEENKIDLFIMDTMSSFWPVRNENDASEVTRALRPFTSFTNRNIAVFLVHHDRKSGGQDFTAIRGSGAFPAFVDNIIEFKLNKDGLPNQRILKVGGRFDGQSQLVIEFTNEEKYIVKGEPWHVSKSARLQKIASICKHENVPLSVPDLFRIWTTTIGDTTKRTIRTYVSELVDNGVLEKVKEEVIDKQVIPYYKATGFVETEENGVIWED